MSLKKMYLVLSVAVFSIMLFSGYAISQDEVIGPISLKNRFPDMGEVGNCKAAYDDFLKVASPIKACHELRGAMAEAKMHQSVIDALEGLQGNDASVKTKNAKTKLSDANAKVKDLKSQCPTGKKFIKLVKKLGEKCDNVCSQCDNKWPGELGPLGGTPCN